MWLIKNSNWDKTQIVTKLKNSNCDKTQIVTKLKLWQNSKFDKSQLLKKFKKNFKGYLSKNNLTPWQPMAAFCNSCDVFFHGFIYNHVPFVHFYSWKKNVFTWRKRFSKKLLLCYLRCQYSDHDGWGYEVWVVVGVVSDYLEAVLEGSKGTARAAGVPHQVFLHCGFEHHVETVWVEVG